jgi:hypothetical protein
MFFFFFLLKSPFASQILFCPLLFKIVNYLNLNVFQIILAVSLAISERVDQASGSFKRFKSQKVDASGYSSVRLSKPGFAQFMEIEKANNMPFIKID